MTTVGCGGNSRRLAPSHRFLNGDECDERYAKEVGDRPALRADSPASWSFPVVATRAAHPDHQGNLAQAGPRGQGACTDPDGRALHLLSKRKRFALDR